jgi:pyrroline-5-carboxylate reductase
VSKTKLVFIGGGNMATSLIGGLLKQGFPTDSIAACDPVTKTRERLHSSFNIATYQNNDHASEADVVILAVKPQILKTVATELTSAIRHRPLVISIAAGIPVAALQTWLGEGVPLIRCMPNTPALLQKGATGLFATNYVSPAQRLLAKDIISAVGTVSWFDTELDIDRVTALSGSGPAYFFLVMEAMENAGVKLGLDRDIARQLTIQTALGAASMASQEEEVEPAELRRQVTSPGGTTESAINSFLADGLPDIFEQAMQAAYLRSIEMADETL